MNNINQNVVGNFTTDLTKTHNDYTAKIVKANIDKASPTGKKKSPYHVRIYQNKQVVKTVSFRLESDANRTMRLLKFIGVNQ